MFVAATLLDLSALVPKLSGGKCAATLGYACLTFKCVGMAGLLSGAGVEL